HNRFSLFLTPCEADYVYLAAMIEGLGAAYGAFPFEPHVTVYSGDLPDPGLLKRAVAAAVEGVAPFLLKVAGIGCSEEYFKSLYVAFRDSALLRGIHERLKVGLGEDSGYRLVPHLSLLYSDIPLGKKEELARRMVLERDEILFDRVKVVSPGNVREGWRDVMEWRTLFSVRLGGAS
ncbi:MAG TPA: hydrolase, partial [Geobacteraceae bacterium]|nr:hydrolase [Geobacteraceae bacterium]